MLNKTTLSTDEFLSAHCGRPDGLVHSGTSDRIETSQTRIFVVELGGALDLNLVHAAFLLLAVHVRGRLENARLGSLCAWGINLAGDGVLSLPVLIDIDNCIFHTSVM